MFKIKNQIGKLYASSVLSNLSLTGAWVPAFPVTAL